MVFSQEMGTHPSVRVAGVGLCALGACRLELPGLDIWAPLNLISNSWLHNQPFLFGSGNGTWKNLKLPFQLDKHSSQKKMNMPRFFFLFVCLFLVIDGRMPFPVNHGASSEDSLLQVIFGIHFHWDPHVFSLFRSANQSSVVV